MEHQLFRLFHNERETGDFERELHLKQREVQKVETKKEKAEDVLKEKKKEQGKLSRELGKIEQEIREVEVEISKKRPQFIKAKERVTHMKKKLDGAIKTLDQVRKANDAHNNDIKKLEDELAEVELAKDEYEATIAGESQSQGRSIQLEDEQVGFFYLKKTYFLMKKSSLLGSRVSSFEGGSCKTVRSLSPRPGFRESRTKS